MPDIDSNKIRKVLTAATSELRDECIRRQGRISFRSTNISSVFLGNPPLLMDQPLGDVDLSELPKACYMRGELDPDDVIDTFKAFVDARRSMRANEKALSLRLRETYPEVPWTTFKGSKVSELAQLLHVCSWYGHEGNLNSTEIWKRLNGYKLVIQSSAFEWGEAGNVSRTRHPKSLRVNFVAMLRSPMSGRLRSTAQCGSLYRFLHASLPDLSVQVDGIFAVAAYAGREYQEILVRGFDLTHSFVGTPTSPELRDIRKCVSAINRATALPYDAIRGWLEPHIGEQAFLMVFGKRSSWTRHNYSPATMREHRRYLLALQDQAIARITHESAEQDNDPLEALQLQQMIR